MQWLLICALLVGTGCGESDDAQGPTVITVADPGPGVFPELALKCANDPSPSGDEVVSGVAPELLDAGGWRMFFSPPPGPCTLRIRLRDQYTGEYLCVQEEEIVVAEVGDTEVEITVDCEAATTPS